MVEDTEVEGTEMKDTAVEDTGTQGTGLPAASCRRPLMPRGAALARGAQR
jgi:hypothetical protein